MPKSHLQYQNDQLGFFQKEKFVGLKKFCQDVCYVYDLNGIEDRVNFYKKNVSAKIHYAMKANSNLQIMRHLSRLELGVDTVSLGEMKLALAAGFKAQDIVLSGVGKSVNEISEAIDLQISQINVESVPELIRIAEIAKQKGKKARVAFRMNPDVNPITHPYIKTGFRENKFGMDATFLPDLLALLKKYQEQLTLCGLTLHIGSQIQTVEPFKEAIEKVKIIYQDLKSQGYPLQTFDVGGGLGLNYNSDLEDDEQKLITEYGKALQDSCKSISAEILSEPGRILVGRYGILLGEVQYIKETPYKKFVILNTGMHHLMRPALYQAHHRIAPVLNRSGVPLQNYDVVGPICESADTIGRDRSLPQIMAGEWLAILDTGAYGFVMANNYNAHALPKEIVVYNGDILSA